MAAWALLPNDCLELVFCKLDPQTLISSAALVCKRWRSTALTSDAVWKRNLDPSAHAQAISLLNSWPAKWPWPQLWLALAPRNLLQPLKDVQWEGLEGSPPRSASPTPRPAAALPGAVCDTAQRTGAEECERRVCCCRVQVWRGAELWQRVAKRVPAHQRCRPCGCTRPARRRTLRSLAPGRGCGPGIQLQLV